MIDVGEERQLHRVQFVQFIHFHASKYQFHFGSPPNDEKHDDEINQDYQNNENNGFETDGFPPRRDDGNG